ncbi:MAG: HAL/PAL/TAL family ammonia-lyase, partial [Acidimicrobiales bacterium]
VPERGSLGASGDLAPLAHLALPVIGEGAVLSGRAAAAGSGGPAGAATTEAAAAALRRAGLEPLALEAKEGLSLINGTQAMVAVGVLASARLVELCRAADLAAAMTTEAILGTDRAFDEAVIALRPHPGQAASAANLRRLLEGSSIVASHRDSPHLVQDAYSLRCAPQVHGALRDTLEFTREVLAREVASVTDNPIVTVDGATGDGLVLSGGNFHGQPVAVALDALAAATVGLASISERRLYRLLDPATSNGLPAFLVPAAGLNSGLMVLQYTAASLVSEAKSLAHPASVDSIPSSAGQEDHVSMGMTAARHLRSCVELAEVVIGAELLAAAQAIELRRPLRPAAATSAAVSALRCTVAPLSHDRYLSPDLDAATAAVRSGQTVRAAETVTGPLA